VGIIWNEDTGRVGQGDRWSGESKGKLKEKGESWSDNHLHCERLWKNLSYGREEICRSYMGAALSSMGSLDRVGRLRLATSRP